MEDRSEAERLRSELELVARLLERRGCMDSLPSLPVAILRRYLPRPDAPPPKVVPLPVEWHGAPR